MMDKTPLTWWDMNGMFVAGLAVFAMVLIIWLFLLFYIVGPAVAYAVDVCMDGMRSRRKRRKGRA